MICKNIYILGMSLLFVLLWPVQGFTTTDVGTNRLKSGVVKIQAQKSGHDSTGSGFIVKFGKNSVYILTAYHTVEEDQQPRVEFFTYSDGRTHTLFQAERIAFHEPNDIALLKVENQDIPSSEELFAFPLASFPLRERDEVEIIGVPTIINNWVIADGKIIQTGTYLYFTGFFEHGSSGGPLVKHDQVVGMSSLSVSGGSYGIAIPVSLLKLFLQDNQINIH